MHVTQFSALVESVYSAALEPTQWRKLPADLAPCFASESMAIQVREGDFNNITLRTTTANYDAAAQRRYVEYFHKLDPFANGWQAIGRPGIFAGHELVDPEKFRNSEMYHDYCEH